MTYLHVVRDGRDMAVSKNQNQVRKHGDAVLSDSFGECQDKIKAIKFWEVTNVNAALYGREFLPDSYLLIRYEDLVSDPQGQVKKIVGFLGGNKEISLDIKSNRTAKWKGLPAKENAELTESAKDGLLFFNYLEDYE
jgi:hypothetical protein